MFPSACSLRSTQCAALIALATAAGISRFEVAETPGSEHAQASSEAQSAGGVSAQTTYYRFVQAFAPWLNALRFGRTAETPVSGHATTAAVAGSEIAALPAALPARLSLRTSPTLAVSHGAAALALGLSVRQHSFPFAVGPPARRAPIHRPVAGTSVPCDSATRSVAIPAVFRIARYESVSVARLARRQSAGAHVARPFFSSSSARCGEPELPLPSRRSARAFLSAGAATLRTSFVRFS